MHPIVDISGGRVYNKNKKYIITISIIIFIIVGGVFYIINWAFFDIQRISGQNYIDESISPNETYTVTA